MQPAGLKRGYTYTNVYIYVYTQKCILFKCCGSKIHIQIIIKYFYLVLKMKGKYLLTLLTLLTIGCSPTTINRSAIIDGEFINQYQKAKKGEITIISNYPDPRKSIYFYTLKKGPILDSIMTRGTMYTRCSNLGNIILDNEQKNLETYLEDLEKL